MTERLGRRSAGTAGLHGPSGRNRSALRQQGVEAGRPRPRRRLGGWLMTLAIGGVWWGATSQAADNGPRVYNQGVAAYRTNDFAGAGQAFERASPAADRALQQRAFYNLGNTCYRLGEAQPAQAQQLWQRAFQSYEAALALDPKDEDAKFNREFVKQKIEELQQQQEQQQQQQQQQKQQDDKKQDQKQSDQQQQQPGQPPQPQDQPPPQPEEKPANQPPPPAPDQTTKDQKDQQPAQPKTPRGQEPQKQSPDQAAGPADQLEKQQAAALLDNLREQEQNWNFFPELQMKDLPDQGPPAKDW